MKGIIILAVLIGGILVVTLNPHLVADQVLDWAQQNTTNVNTPEILFDTAHACQTLQDGDTAIRVYNYLYQQYPDNAVLCAQAMYYCGKIKADSSYLKGIRVQALPFLDIVINEYSKQQEWADKSQQLKDEVIK